jgi:hypothetical protein
MTREIPSQSRETLEVPLIPLALTSLVAWRCLMRPVSLHPSSFALPPWLRPRSNGHRHRRRQNRLRPAPRSRQKISRHAMAEEGGASPGHLVGKQSENRRKIGTIAKYSQILFPPRNLCRRILIKTAFRDARVPSAANKLDNFGSTDGIQNRRTKVAPTWNAACVGAIFWRQIFWRQQRGRLSGR